MELLGRDREREALGRLLAEARLGRSGVLALLGEAGIGKSALLAEAEELAGGMRLLRARGVESEAQVPFAALYELLRPALDGLGRIPKPQAVALETALALRPGRAGDRFAVGAATLSLLAVHAETEPVAVLVDDAHWLDGSSADALLFAIRRLLADPVAVVLAARVEEASLLDGAGLPALRVEGLDPTAAASLLGRDAGDPLAERLHRDTGGNPLALLELAAQDVVSQGLPPGVPVPAVTSVARVFGRRLAALPERTREVLLLASAHAGGDLASLARAAEALGLDLADLDPAEADGLVSLRGGRLEFRHPLARSAAYGEASAARRREAHRALADALPDAELDRRAWHLALAATGTDAAAASALEQAGRRAQERSAYVVASSAFERAARISPDPAGRGRLLYEAADAAWLGGLAERALALVDEEPGGDASLRARIEHLRGHVVTLRGPVPEGRAILEAAAEEAAASDPERAMLMLADAAQAAFWAGDAEALAGVSERAQTLRHAAESRSAAFFADVLRGMALVFGGQGEAGAAALRDAVEALERADMLDDDPRVLCWAAMAPLWLREAAVGRDLVTHAVDAVRDRAAVGALPLVLNLVSIDLAGAGRWTAAEAGFDEAMRLARESGQRTALALSLSRLAWLAGRQGREQACRELAAQALALAGEVGAGLCEIWTLSALAELELVLGRAEAALEQLERLRQALASRGVVDPDLAPAPDLVDVLLRLGLAADAEAAATEYALAAETKGQPWARARAARARGLIAGEDELDRCFGEALRLHEQTPDAFETARTQLAYGSRLRRARRRVQARASLRAAIETFDRLGAEPWAEQARAELAATGETARRRDPSTLDALTPQELQIGLLLAEGRTTREAAAALFLSPKTIEYHLRNAYRKLGINSREQLAEALARRG